MELYYERIWLPRIKSCIKVKQLKNHALMGLINKPFCFRYRPLKNAVNTWLTEKQYIINRHHSPKVVSLGNSPRGLI